MSTNQHKADSSLNNLPETNAAKIVSSGTSGSSADVIGSGKGKEGSIPTGTDNTNEQHDAPNNKHGDSWGGGIPGHNSQFK
jgi:hypothetical protein